MRRQQVLATAGVVAVAFVLAWGAPRHQDVAAMGYGGGGTGGGGGGHSGYGGYGGGMGQSTLAFDPSAVTVAQGETAAAKVTVTLASGRTWGTNLKVMDAPMGITITFDPVSGEPPFTSKVSVQASPTATVGTYTVKLQATGDDPSPVTSFQLTVTKGSSGGY